MKNNSNPIGFFDSGIGGLSVYSCFMDKLKTENTIYVGDLKNLPYGNKTKDELIHLARKILDFFKTQNVKAAVIACNTSSALAYEAIKNEYDFKIYPIVQIVSKAISDMNYSKVNSFFIYYATNGTGNADELAVIEVKDSSDLSEARKSLEAHLETRKSLYSTYDKSQLKKLEAARIATNGNCAALIVGDEADKISDAFQNFINNN